MFVEIYTNMKIANDTSHFIIKFNLHTHIIYKLHLLNRIFVANIRPS